MGSGVYILGGYQTDFSANWARNGWELADGMREVLEQEASEFAAASAPLLLRPDALKAWRRHRHDGARTRLAAARVGVVRGCMATGRLPLRRRSPQRPVDRWCDG